MKKKVTLFLILCLSAMLSACGFSVGYSEYKYADAESYQVGADNVYDVIEQVDVDWQAGEVCVDYWDKGYIGIEENANMELNDKISLHYLVIGDKLNVKFCASGEGSSLINLKKTLNLKVPRTFDLKKIKISTASADITTGLMSSKEVDFNSASGNISALLESAIDIKLTTASGNIDANVEAAAKTRISSASGKIDAIIADVEDSEMTTASGDITVKQKETAEKLRIESASGKIELKSHNVKSAEVNSSSGNMKLKFKKVPEVIDVRTTSGKMVLQLPEDAEFVASIKSASGDFDCEFPDVVRNGKTYTRGQGSCDINISTTSGDMKLKPIEDEKEEK